MEVDNAVRHYNLDRKAASKLLKISVRTLDRYIRSKKMSTQVVDGRVWLDKGELEAFKRDKAAPVKVDSVNMSTSPVSMDTGVDTVDNIEYFSQETVDTVETQKRKKGSSQIYKKLYLELKEDLNEKQGRLEIANYRVGQLEAQLKSSMPMLEYHRENFEHQKAKEDLKQALSDGETVIKKLSTSLKYEKFNKRIFLIILLTILAIQPLWLLMLYK